RRQALPAAVLLGRAPQERSGARVRVPGRRLLAEVEAEGDGVERDRLVLAVVEGEEASDLEHRVVEVVGAAVVGLARRRDPVRARGVLLAVRVQVARVADEGLEAR